MAIKYIQTNTPTCRTQNHTSIFISYKNNIMSKCMNLMLKKYVTIKDHVIDNQISPSS